MKFLSLHQARPDHFRQWQAAFAQRAGPLADDPRYYPLVFDLAASIAENRAQQVPTVSVAGAQGSGKTTLAALLAWLLAEAFGLKTAVLSLDDFYLTRAERQRLARQAHPLLATRGVPGTHDVNLMQAALGELKAGRGVPVPQFDKAADDRAAEPRLQAAADVILCEGWCWGARPESEADLAVPVNDLETGQDPQGSWRHFVNQALHEYQALFATDGSVFLAAPSMAAVYRWRWQQEQALRETGRAGAGIMSEPEVRAFIAHYERLTRRMLVSAPASVDVCVQLAENHTIRALQGFR